MSGPHSAAPLEQSEGPPSGTRLRVTVLGSGGPTTSRHRASAGYVVWVDDDACLLIDAGGGTFERLGELGVSPAGLGAVALTHLHIDHSGGLAPVVFAAWMEGRTTPLTVIGPVSGHGQPGCHRFCDLLFGVHGAWSYLHTFDGFEIHPIETAGSPDAIAEPLWTHRSGLTLRAAGVEHGMMPTVAYRVDLDGRSITFSGDLHGIQDSIIELAARTDVLIFDQALPRREIEHGDLHSPPGDTAQVAAQAGVGTLVLSHLMPPIEPEIDTVVATIAATFTGRIVVAHDLLTIHSDGATTTP